MWSLRSRCFFRHQDEPNWLMSYFNIICVIWHKMPFYVKWHIWHEMTQHQSHCISSKQMTHTLSIDISLCKIAIIRNLAWSVLFGHQLYTNTNININIAARMVVFTFPFVYYKNHLFISCCYRLLSNVQFCTCWCYTVLYNIIKNILSYLYLWFEKKIRISNTWARWIYIKKVNKNTCFLKRRSSSLTSWHYVQWHDL